MEPSTTPRRTALGNTRRPHDFGNGPRHRHLPSVLGGLALLACTAGPATAQGPALPEGLFDGLDTATVPAPPADPSVSPEVTPVDPTRPAIALRRIRDALGALYPTAAGRNADLLRRAGVLADAAWRTYANGAPDLSHLPRTVGTLAEVLALLDGLDPADEATARAVAPIRTDIVFSSEQIARDLLGILRRADADDARVREAATLLASGMLAALEGDMPGGVGRLGDSVLKSGGGLRFDVELFEQNLVDALAGASIGYAFAVAFQGQLVGAGTADGLARTSANAPALDQSPSKEAQVASVSKTITAIMIMNLLEENGLTPDDEVAPFLPSSWDPGAGFDELTFADFMTHKSGFGQISAGDSYNALRTAVETAVGLPSANMCPVFNGPPRFVAPLGYCYRNANYGLMRVLTAGLMGFDIATLPTPVGEDLTAYAFFRNHADTLYGDLGIEIDCVSNDTTPTILYFFPDNMLSGSQDVDRRRTCGGFGWHISAIEIASIMTNLRNSTTLMSAEYREMMQNDFLGFLDPANGFDFAQGAFGTYYMHGGDWFLTFGEMHTCAAAFPIQLEVGLIINSSTSGITYQCQVLKNAFETAWVAN